MTLLGGALAGLLLAAGSGGALIGPRLAAGHGDARAVDPEPLGYTYGVGVFAPEYAPPAPGSYALPPIQRVQDHALVDDAGRPTTLFAQKGDRLAIVSFIYRGCADTEGCPVSTAALHQIDRALAADPALARQVTLITVSFDPERDTPARMAAARELHQPRADWRFVTTRDDAQLAPLLADFDQPVAKLRLADGSWSGLYRHVLKVFLLDGTNRVRNVYSTGFLHAALVLADLRTLYLERRAATGP